MIRLRGHHLLCILTYQGTGYTKIFCRNFDRVLKRLSTAETIEIIAGPDDICLPRLRDGADRDVHCHLHHIDERDQRALDAVGPLLGMVLKPGSRIALTAATIHRLRRAFQNNTIRSACCDCSWQALCTDIANTNFEGAHLSG